MYKKAGALEHRIDFFILDLVLFALSYVIGYLLRFGFQIVDYLITFAIRSGLILLVIYLLCAILTRAYKKILHRNKWTELVSVLGQEVITLIVFLMYLYLTKQSDVLPRLMFGYTAIVALVLIWAARCLYKNILRNHYQNNPKLAHLLVVADDKNVRAAIEAIRNQKFNEFYLSGVVVKGDEEAASGLDCSLACDYSGLKSYVLANIVDEILLALDDNEERMELTKYFLEAGIAVHISLEKDEASLPNVMTGIVGGNLVLTTSNSVASAFQLAVKRAIDIIGGIVGLIITGVLFIIIAPQIKAKDPGPVFFKQKRVGKNGRIFYIYKFRSMYLDAEERKKELMAQNEMQGLMFKMEDDPRILPGIGHKIRDWSLDEFPQFFNVFKGDMSLVGTRPPTLDEYSHYEAHHKSRLSFKPGLTGMWQVSGRSKITDFEEIVKLDNDYIRKWNLRLDIKILFKTVGVVLGRKGSM